MNDETVLIGTQWSAFAVCSVHMNLGENSLGTKDRKGGNWDILVIRKVGVRKVELYWKNDPRFSREWDEKDGADSPCLRAARRASSPSVVTLVDAGSVVTGTPFAGADSGTDMIEPNKIKMIQEKR